jgi:UDP-glucose 4-epimerase
MKTVIVTGGAGFIGSHTVDLLLQTNHSVVVIDDFSKGLRTNITPQVTVIEVDISNRSSLLSACAGLREIDFIIHCAAQASVVVSTHDLERDLLVNVAGTINMLDLASKHQCPVVFASTGGAIYGRDSIRPTSELAMIGPESPYGASKAGAEIYVHLAAQRDRLAHSICRLGNVYGPRQRGDGEAGVVAILTERLAGDLPVTLFGYGTPTRDYVHVQDVARALISAVGIGGTFNIATSVETTVQRVYELVRSGLPLTGVRDPELMPLRNGELQASCLDISRARNDLNWHPTISVEDGIPATVADLLGAK